MSKKTEFMYLQISMNVKIGRRPDVNKFVRTRMGHTHVAVTMVTGFSLTASLVQV